MRAALLILSLPLFGCASEPGAPFTGQDTPIDAADVEQDLSVDSRLDADSDIEFDGVTDTELDSVTLDADAEPATIEETIFAAGQSEEEPARFALLATLIDHPDADDALLSELATLLPIVDQWANGRERYWVPGDQPTAGEGGYLAGFFNLRVLPDLGGPTLPPRVRDDSPLYPIWALYRGRMLIWSGIQTGSFVSDDEGMELWFGGGRELLREAATAFPDNRIIGMYLDQPISWPGVEPDPNAPEWANLQREALNKLLEIVEFWIDERQAPDGQFGGGWGDDVEMWRWWIPVLVAFEEPRIVEAQRLLSDGIFALPRLEGGYSNILTDVEHSAEDSSDAITAMLLAQPGEEVWEERADRIAELAESSWIARNERGFLQFQSVYFTPSIVSSNERYACDTTYHSRALQPVFQRWRQSPEHPAGELLSDWLDTWVDAAARSERGKPAGVLPSAIHWPSGEIGGPGDDWWEPGCAENAGAFVFPSSLQPMSELLVLAWEITGEERYLAPIHSMAELYRAHLADPGGSMAEGTNTWTASKLSRITGALARYRAASDDPSYDDLILGRSSGYRAYRLTGELDALETSLLRLVESVSFNRAAYTSEVRYTDRIRKFSANYANEFADTPISSFDHRLLYEMLSGDVGDPLYYPQQTVRWVTTPRDYAALVTESSRTALRADVFVFDEAERDVGVTLMALEPGNYSWSLSCEGSDVASGSVDRPMSGFGRIDLLVPAGLLCSLIVGNPD